MRIALSLSRRALGALFFSSAALSIAVFACGGSGDGDNANTANDSGSEASDDGANAQDTKPAPPLPDAAQAHCTLADGTDPVGLCIQKTVLKSLHALMTDGGVPASWDPLTGIADSDDAGSIAHRLHDDVAYGAALARYQVNAGQYGDSEIDDIVTADLARIAAIVEREMAPLPDEYGGELYRDLRYLAVGLRYTFDDDDATKIDAIANAYGRAIYDAHYHALAAQNDAILGASANGGAFAYDAVDATTGAFALVDMATSHAPDASTAAAWESAGLAVIDHVWRRARDAQTGVIARTLVTSDDPSGDTKTGEALTTDAQATIALALLRMRELVPADAAASPALAAYPFGDHATSAIASLNAPDASLWDDASTGYFTGFVSPDGGVDTTKPTRANALLAAAIQRSAKVSATPYRAQVDTLRKLLTAPSPTAYGFFAAVLDQAGYFPALTRDFKLPDGSGSAGPRARHYETAATTSACEGLSDLGPAVPGAMP